jgi:hypothetical protein
MFAYCIPEMAGVKTQAIRMGSQVPIPGELNPMQVDAIIEQHRIYGLVTVEEFERMKAFVPFVASVDRPVKMETIQRVMALNTGVLVKRGQDMRKEAAVAVNAAIEEITPSIETLEMSVEEERQGSFSDRDAMSEGVRVSRGFNPDGSPKDAPRRGRPRKAA